MVPGGGGAHGGGQLVDAVSLGHEAGAARGECLAEKGGVDGGGDEYHADPRPDRLQLRRRVGALAVGETLVEEEMTSTSVTSRWLRASARLPTQSTTRMSASSLSATATV